MIAACLVAVCCAVVGAVFLALGQGSLTQSGAVCSILIGMIGGAWCGVATFRRTPRKDWKLVEGLLAIVFALFALRAFCWLVYPSDEAIKVLSPNNLGDMSLHLTYIRYLANGARFWPANPIFSDTPLHYPIGMDLFNALLTLLQVDLFRGLIWVGLIGCGFCAITLHRWGGS
ncbi:MAG: hypothetical protein QOD99_937, partial [Chthoniobacter sp.]|nr:hypothetical protein [Chthoniobacter sp.]